MTGKPAIHTIGHSTHPLDEFVAILNSANIDFLVDVRTIPRSRTNPQFNQDSLPYSLEPHGIGWRHIAALGGLRGKPKALVESANPYWENKSFRNYADHALGDNFRQGLAELEELAAHRRCAVMCAEAVWWRCHRRIIADYLLVRQYPVFHIMGLDKINPATLTEAAHVEADQSIRYI